MKKQITLALFLCAIVVKAQEVEVPLGYNPVLVKAYKKAGEHARIMAPGDTLEIPFFDDFAGDSYYPDQRKWQDRAVFINRTMPYSPPTLGVATFDGLRDDGQPYSYFQNNGRCDSLTSKPIKLGGFLPTDNVYVSFYYQARGRGDTPETGDTLSLEFFAPGDTVKPWKQVWTKVGQNTPTLDTSFKYVSVKISDTIYLKDGFQFRFRNFGGRYGNIDHWHVDYVNVDRKTNPLDSSALDVAFVNPLKSMLADYSSVPWLHFKSNQASSKPFIYNRIRNLDDTTQSSSFNAEIYDQNLTLLHTVRANSSKIISSLSSDTVTFDIPAQPFPVAGNTNDFAEFSLVGRLAGINASANDTVRYIQRFYDYYSYDDGTAEVGYGVTVQGAQVAYKFLSINPGGDVLKAVQIFFTYINLDVRQRNIKLMVWADGGGKPGTVLYSQPFFVQPRFDGLTDFHIYDISEGNVNVSGVFYIGFMQEANDILNIGVDKNTDVSGNMFYNTQGTWLTTQFSGAWMMRPMFGPRYPYGIEGNKPVQEILKLYPNPVSDRLYIESVSGDHNSFQISDLSGRIVLTGDKHDGSIDVSSLSEGVYLIKSGTSSFQKFIVTR